LHLPAADPSNRALPPDNTLKKEAITPEVALGSAFC
jgi:hypothetical protein